MGTIALKYTGQEAVDIIKNYYPKDWQAKLEQKKTALIRLSQLHKISIIKAYKKFIIPVAGNQESIMFFAALSLIIDLEKMTPRDKSDKVNLLLDKRQRVADQIVILEGNNKTISDEDKKTLRAYYDKLQQEHTKEIDELIKSFKVIEPELIIHQPGLFDKPTNC